jgi:ADP-ribosyl-[dinitrogen reductase] hydrolase
MGPASDTVSPMEREGRSRRASPAPNRTEAARGCLLGLALGDALGAPFEFMRAKDIPRPVPGFQLPWRGLPPGTTTDDTALARNLARSLIDRGGFDPIDLIARHLAWFESDPPDIGSLTRRVLRRIQGGTPAAEAAEAVWRERGPEVSAGNGSVMYCAPLGVAYAHRPDRLSELAPRLSALTHFDERCRTAVLAVALTVAAVLRGEEPQAAASGTLEAVIDRDGGEELEYLVEAAGTTRPVDGPDQGFCLYTAGVGLQALTREGSFRDRLLHVVSLGGDTDTNGAVAGALVGAALGGSALPALWLDLLRDRADMEAEAYGLAVLAESQAVRRSEN